MNKFSTIKLVVLLCMLPTLACAATTPIIDYPSLNAMGANVLSVGKGLKYTTVQAAVTAAAALTGPVTIEVPGGVYTGNISATAGRINILALGPVVFMGTVTTHNSINATGVTDGAATITLMGNIQVIRPGGTGIAATDSGVSFYNPGTPVPVTVVCHDGMVYNLVPDTTAVLYSLPGVSYNDSAGETTPIAGHYDAVQQVSAIDYAWLRGVPISQAMSSADVTWPIGDYMSLGQMRRENYWRGAEFMTYGGSLVNPQGGKWTGPTTMFPMVGPPNTHVRCVVSGGVIQSATVVWQSATHVQGELLYVWPSFTGLSSSTTDNGGVHGTLVATTVVNGLITVLGVNTGGANYVADADGIAVYPALSAQYGLVALGSGETTVTANTVPVISTNSYRSGIGFAAGQVATVYNDGASADTVTVASAGTPGATGSISSITAHSTNAYTYTGGTGCTFMLTGGNTYFPRDSTITPANGGTGYAVGDILAILGGTTNSLNDQLVRVATLSTTAVAAAVVCRNFPADVAHYTANATLNTGICKMLTVPGAYPTAAAAYTGETLGVRQFLENATSADVVVNKGASEIPLPLGLLVNGALMYNDWHGPDEVLRYDQYGFGSIYPMSTAAPWISAAKSAYSFITGGNVDFSGPYSPYFGGSKNLNALLSPISLSFNMQPPASPTIFGFMIAETNTANYAPDIASADFKKCIDLLSAWQQAGLIRCMSPTMYFTPSQWNAPNGLPQSIDTLTAAQTTTGGTMRYSNSGGGAWSATGGNPGACITLIANAKLNVYGVTFSGSSFEIPKINGFTPGRIHVLEFDVCGSNLAINMGYNYIDSTGTQQGVSSSLNKDLINDWSGYYRNGEKLTGNIATHLLFGSGPGPGWRHYRLNIGIPTWAQTVSMTLQRQGYGSDNSDGTIQTFPDTSPLNITKVANLTLRLN